MNPRANLELAYELLDGSREVDWRGAVGRAYYAAFHVALEFLGRCGFRIPQNEAAHVGVSHRLSNCGHTLIQAEGYNLRSLRTVRNWADYELPRFLDHHTAFGFVQTADSIIETLDDALTMPPLLAQLTAAIQVYERDVLQQVTFRP